MGGLCGRLPLAVWLNSFVLELFLPHAAMLPLSSSLELVVLQLLFLITAELGHPLPLWWKLGLYGSHVAWLWIRLEQVIFESDNLQLINSVCNGASSCLWEIRSLVEYVLLWVLRGHGHAKVWMKEQRSGAVLYTCVIFCRLLTLYLKILQMYESGRDIAV